MEFHYELKIPKNRIAVLIGQKGKNKRFIEDSTSTAITIDSKEGDITIEGDDGLELFTAREVISAIGRGFNPEIALLLLKQDYGKEILSISDFARSKNDFDRLRGRVIGRDGKSRSMLEHYTETSICIFGKTIGVIGRSENVSICRRAIVSILSGSPHTSVWRWLEKQRRQLKNRELSHM